MVERLVSSGQSQHCVVFRGPDGRLKSSTQIDSREEFQSYHVAVFKSGEILLSGQQGEGGHTPFTGVFDANGKLIKKIFEPEDDDLRKRAEGGDTSLLSSSSNYGNEAVVDGGLVAGPGDHIYVMRRTSPAVIYEISPGGQVVRKLRIDSGDTRLPASDLHFAAGKLAVLFHGFVDGSSANILKVVDPDGNLIASYDSLTSPLPTGPLGCFVPPVLTFVTSDDGPGRVTYLNQVETK